MLCRGTSGNDHCKGSVPVYLNVYDLTSINGYAYWFGLGVYHSGVQVHGVEYAFGAHEYSTTGIFEGEPKQCEGFMFRKTILIGKTDKGAAEVREIMEEFSETYRGNAYNLITKNCNHFCDDVCVRLTGNPIPSWINRLARIGFLCNCVVPVTISSIKIRNDKAEEKTIEEEKKELKSQSDGVRASNCSSSSSSSSSNCSIFRRGRNRTRRALPPTSPFIFTSF